MNVRVAKDGHAHGLYAGFNKNRVISHSTMVPQILTPCRRTTLAPKKRRLMILRHGPWTLEFHPGLN